MTGGSYLGFERIPEWLDEATGAGKWSIDDIYAARLENEWPKYRIPIEYVVVGGGGGTGGARDNVQITGGGGAGGYRSSVFNEYSGGLNKAESPYLVEDGDSFTVTVGAGGSAGSAAGDGTYGGVGTNGSSSRLGSIICTGGGLGGRYNQVGGSGGSGGGGGIANAFGGQTSSSSQGFDGAPGAGYGLLGETDVYGGTGAGGGGGAGGPGQPGIAVGSPSLAGQLGHYRQTPADVATTEHINRSSPPATIDGVTLTDGMRVLVKDQNDPIYNGVFTYIAAENTVNTRVADLNAGAEFDPGTYIEVASGTVNGGTAWAIETRYSTGDIVLNTDPIIFVQSTAVPPKGGNGGVGIVSSITGSAVGRAGGGGGGASGGPTRAGDGVTSRTSPGGTGVHGGRTAGTPSNNNGTGGYATGNTAGVSGTANRGGGGSGSAFMVDASGGVAGGAGGSGVVILRYPSEYANLTVGAGLTYTGPTTVGIYKVYEFTAGTGTVTFNV